MHPDDAGMEVVLRSKSRVACRQLLRGPVLNNNVKSRVLRHL